jgi:hypothetical protein
MPIEHQAYIVPALLPRCEKLTRRMLRFGPIHQQLRQRDPPHPIRRQINAGPYQQVARTRRLSHICGMPRCRACGVAETRLLG